MDNLNQLCIMLKDKEIFNYLYDVGCCKRCCLRYLCARSPESYINLESYVLQRKFLPEENIKAKKLKSNPCVVCLGLLQNFCVDSVIDKVANHELVTAYDSEVFTCSVSYPACIAIREHSIKLYLEKQFPDLFTKEAIETPINKVWKWIIRDKMSEKLNKKFESSETCAFSINVLLNYELDTEELSVLLNMQPKLFSVRKKQHRKYHGELYTRKGVLTALEQTSKYIFVENAKVPPEISTKSLECRDVQFNHDSIYVAGRYCKFSRELSQTPWLINGVRQMESSVLDVIFEGIKTVLNLPENTLIFSASGREDVDVRCLGKGRPFYTEIRKPQRTKFTFQEMREIENEVNKSELIKIRDLQMVDRSELVHIKQGEESKTKEYVALCHVKSGVTSDMIQKVNEYGSVELKQKTPIRVMHRRPLAVRLKTVHNMSAKAVAGNDNLFTLMLTTQAGTYVKEFVHGDFGRTVPNMGTILGEEVDIIALDVVSVNLDWPKEIEPIPK